MKVAAKPCPACPFSRDVTPGALGGTAPEAYIGQSLGPFVLPCHMHYGENGEGSTPDTCTEVTQCAGAAVFRTHIGVARSMPDAIPVLPPNPQVFSDEWEFLAHHKGTSVESEKVRHSRADFLGMLWFQLRRAARGERP